MRYRSDYSLRLSIGVLCLAALAVPASSGRGGGNANRPNDMAAHAYQFRPGAPGSFIRVQWNRGKSVLSSDVLQYVLWRGDTTSPSQIVAALNGDTSRFFIDNEAARTVTAFNGAPATDSAGTRTTILNVPGIVTGERYVYQVSSAYENALEDRNFDGVPDAGAEFMSPLSVGSRYITALAGPTITGINGQSPSGGLQVDLNSLTVEWSQTPGADTYVIVASSTPRFQASKRTTLATVRSPAVNEGGPATLSRTVKVGKGLRGKNRLFLSVGARRSGDPKPRPFGAIFGPLVEVSPEAGPPAPPDGSAASAPRGERGRRKHRRR